MIRDSTTLRDMPSPTDPPRHRHTALETWVIAEIRERGNISQIMREAGIERTLFHHWANGNVRMSVDRVQALLKVLGYRLVAVPMERK